MLKLTEDQLEHEALGWLEETGYTLISGPDIAPEGCNPQRRRLQQVVLTDRLRAAIARLNPLISESALDDVVKQVEDLNTPELMKANRKFHQMLTSGVPYSLETATETLGQFAAVIDWEEPENNEFWAVNQLTVKGRYNVRRPDIVLYVNGLPLVVIELKNAINEKTDIWEAFNQVQTYKQQISDLFEYNEILVISDGSEARFGSLSANAERFMQWRTIDGIELDPLGPFSELETMVRGLLAPSYLLDYLRYFVLFEDEGMLLKKIAGYHQYHAVRFATEQVIKATRPEVSAEQQGRGGVVWHTQGSGKSITMTCFAARIMQHAAMENPTLVVITDRNDLDDQLFGVFSLAEDLLRERPVQADTRQRLRELLANRPSGGIIFATIQKFMPGADEDSFPTLSDRHNIVVIADEAHRTQYGFEAKLKEFSDSNQLAEAQDFPIESAPANDEEIEGASSPAPKVISRYQPGYAQHLRDALPNATFVAFTGTPVNDADRNTQAVFGDYIHIYDMVQAKEDGATVAIYYESRLAKLQLSAVDLEELDAEVDELAKHEEEDEQAKLKSQWTSLERVVGATPRVERIAADLVSHFEERSAVQDGKAMIVGMSREICVHLYNEIIKLRPEWHDEDPEKGVIKVVITGAPSDKDILQPHIYAPSVRKRLETRFKTPSDPMKLVIVRDMWLTGFDAPCVHTMYVDKPMKGHNLMQAIARVNRVFRDKQGGLVVDYIGIGTELKEAMREYTTGGSRGGRRGLSQPTVDIEEAWSVAHEKLDILRGLLHGYDYSGFKTGGYQAIAGAANHVLSLPSVPNGPGKELEGRRRFADNAVALSKAFSLCCTLGDAKAVRNEVAFMQAVKVLLTKRDLSAQRQSDEQREIAIRQIISQAVVSEDVVDIFDAVGLEKPNIGLLDEAFLAQIKELPEKHLAIELLERLLKNEIRSRFSQNIVQEKKFSEMLESVINRYQSRSIETAQVMEHLVELAKEFNASANRGERLGLEEEEILFYDALAHNESAARELSDGTLRKLANELTSKLRKSVTVDWSKRESVRASMRLMVKHLLRAYRYPPDQSEGAVELVLEQAERVSESWSQ